ncbi:MAG: TonB-dependent receptor [Sphingomonas sp.]|nr:TonB-dependent receptor [Sphingomonas sp.]
MRIARLGGGYGPWGARRLALLATAAMPMLLLEPAHAAAGAEDKASAAISEIVVTAQKKEQSISKVPMSITAIGQTQIDQQGIKDPEALGRLSPGLHFSTGFTGQPDISIRGLSSPVGASTTGIYIDDTPIQNRAVIAGIGAAFPRLFDLDRVEILRGPQGTLFGAGSEGGTIRFITPAPSMTSTSGYATADLSFTQYGSPSYEGGAAIGTPIVSDVLGLRASLWGQHQGGYIDRVDPTTGATRERNANSSHSVVGRLALTFKPTDQLTITPSVFLQSFHKANPDQFFESAGRFKSLYKIDQPLTDKFGIYSTSIDYRFDSFTVKSITSYYDRHQNRTNDYSYFEASAYQGGPYQVTLPDGSLYDYIARQTLKSSQKNFTEEFRVSSNTGPDDRFSWIAGIFVSRERQGNDQIVLEPIDVLIGNAYGLSVEQFFGVPNSTPQWREQITLRTREIAAFGELAYNITPQLKLTAGLRASHARFSFVDAQEGPEAGGSHVYSGSTKESPVTPKFNVSYQANPDWLIYGTAAKGYRIGGANSAMATNPSCLPSLGALGVTDAPRTYDSDQVWSYEIGDKQKLFDRRVSLSASAFWIDWRKIQGSVFVASCGLQYLTNFGSAVSRGFDLEAQARLTRALTLSGTLGYTNAHYVEDSFQPGGAQVARKGEALQNTPRWTGSVSGQYDFAVSDRANAYVRLDYQYTGPYFGSPAPGVNGYDAGVRNQPGSGILSARAGVTHGKWEFSTYVNNILNTRTPLQRLHDFSGEVASSTNPDGLFRGVTYRPFTAGITAKVRY